MLRHWRYAVSGIFTIIAWIGVIGSIGYIPILRATLITLSIQSSAVDEVLCPEEQTGISPMTVLGGPRKPQELAAFTTYSRQHPLCVSGQGQHCFGGVPLANLKSPNLPCARYIANMCAESSNW